MTVELLTPIDVARACQVSEKTVRRAISTGELRVSRLGARGALRIRPEWVQDWIEDRAAATQHTVTGKPRRGRLALVERP